MIKHVLNHLQYSMCADTALLLFTGIFIAVCLRTIWLNKTETLGHARIVLSDEMEMKTDE